MFWTIFELGGQVKIGTHKNVFLLYKTETRVPTLIYNELLADQWAKAGPVF